MSHILEKNEVPDTLNGISVKYEDATIIIPDSTLFTVFRFIDTRDLTTHYVLQVEVK